MSENVILTRAELQDAQRAHERAEFFQWIAGGLCVLVMVLGGLLGFVASERETVIRTSVQQSVALPK